VRDVLAERDRDEGRSRQTVHAAVDHRSLTRASETGQTDGPPANRRSGLSLTVSRGHHPDGPLAQLAADSPYELVLTALVSLGAGLGLAVTAATTAITSGLPAGKEGVGSALNDLSRELGMALGIAVTGSVLTSSYRGHLSTADLPPAIDRAEQFSLPWTLHVGGGGAAQPWRLQPRVEGRRGRPTPAGRSARRTRWTRAEARPVRR
jgi:hypothetical protein